MFFGKKEDCEINISEIDNQNKFVVNQRIDFLYDNKWWKGDIISIDGTKVNVVKKKCKKEITIDYKNIHHFGYHTLKGHDDYKYLKEYFESEDKKESLNLYQVSKEDQLKIIKLKKNGFNIKYILKDGDCFYRCLCRILNTYEDLPEEDENGFIQMARQMVAGYIVENHVEDVDRISLGKTDLYIKGIENKAFAGQLEIEVAHKLFNINIHVYEYKDDEISTYIDQEGKGNIDGYLLYIDKASHFELLVKEEDEDIDIKKIIEKYMKAKEKEDIEKTDTITKMFIEEMMTNTKGKNIQYIK